MCSTISIFQQIQTNVNFNLPFRHFNILCLLFTMQQHNVFNAFTFLSVYSLTSSLLHSCFPPGYQLNEQNFQVQFIACFSGSASLGLSIILKFCVDSGVLCLNTYFICNPMLLYRFSSCLPHFYISDPSILDVSSSI